MVVPNENSQLSAVTFYRVVYVLINKWT